MAHRSAHWAVRLFAPTASQPAVLAVFLGTVLQPHMGWPCELHKRCRSMHAWHSWRPPTSASVIAPAACAGETGQSLSGRLTAAAGDCVAPGLKKALCGLAWKFLTFVRTCERRHFEADSTVRRRATVHDQLIPQESDQNQLQRRLRLGKRLPQHGWHAKSLEVPFE